MVKLIYDENSVINAKKNIKVYNENIIDSIKNISSEYQNIDTILNTPKSQKGVPAYLDEFNKQLTYLTDNMNNFDTLFDAIEEEYKNYVEEIRKMVGSNYEEK